MWRWKLFTHYNVILFHVVFLNWLIFGSVYIIYLLDIDECKEKSACQCDGCKCNNKWGSFECKCSGNRLYMKEQDTCIGKCQKQTIMIYNLNRILILFLFFFFFAEKSGSGIGWFFTFVILATVGSICVGGYVFYKYRLRVCLYTFASLIESLNSLLSWISLMIILFLCQKHQNASLTWIQKLWRLCLSTCHWRAKTLPIQWLVNLNSWD